MRQWAHLKEYAPVGAFEEYAPVGAFEEYAPVGAFEEYAPVGAFEFICKYAWMDSKSRNDHESGQHIGEIKWHYRRKRRLKL
ncbi:MAG: hypothetical protein O2868_09590 [Proteobacteria bacterium]|nr:hypothetical protein [Pseudomonadota bacterium]